MAILAKAIYAKHETLALATLTMTLAASNKLFQYITILKQKLDGILGTMQDTMERVLQALTGLFAVAGIGPLTIERLIKGPTTKRFSHRVIFADVVGQLTLDNN